MVLILVVALLVVGPQRLPGLARSLGRSMAEFRRHANDLRHTLQEADVSESLKKATKPPDSYRIAPPDLSEAEGPEEGEAAAAKPATTVTGERSTPSDSPSPTPDENGNGEQRGG